MAVLTGPADLPVEQANPMLAYYDTRGRTIFRIYCGTHFEMDAVYPGAAPKEDTTGSITIANGKTQMDFAGYVLPPPEVEMPTDLPFFNQADSSRSRIPRRMLSFMSRPLSRLDP